jgi:flavin reductase (DIM6/NTAB) family NADH-FMN oxidoreductase RutF
MFYETANNDHGLKYNPYKSIVTPRPIGWISTLSRDGIANLAPYSQFNNLGYDPPYVMFSAGSNPGDGRRKDSVLNATETGEFVANMATYELRHEVDKSSHYVDPEIDEFDYAGLTKEASQMVKPPRVAESPVHLECRFVQSMVLPGNSLANIVHIVVGEVVGVHIRDEFIGADGKLDMLKIRPLARMGYFDYTSVESIFTMAPSDAEHEEWRRKGLGGEAKGRRPAAE